MEFHNNEHGLFDVDISFDELAEWSFSPKDMATERGQKFLIETVLREAEAQGIIESREQVSLPLTIRIYAEQDHLHMELAPAEDDEIPEDASDPEETYTFGEESASEQPEGTPEVDPKDVDAYVKDHFREIMKGVFEETLERIKKQIQPPAPEPEEKVLVVATLTTLDKTLDMCQNISRYNTGANLETSYVYSTNDEYKTCLVVPINKSQLTKSIIEELTPDVTVKLQRDKRALFPTLSYLQEHGKCVGSIMQLSKI